eukprot:g73123.t1
MRCALRQSCCFPIMAFMGMVAIGALVYFIYTGVEIFQEQDAKAICNNGFYDGQKCFWETCYDPISQIEYPCSCGPYCLDPSEIGSYFRLIWAGAVALPLVFALFVYCCVDKSTYDPFVGAILWLFCCGLPGACYCTYAKAADGMSDRHASPPQPKLGEPPHQEDFARMPP